MDRAKKEVGNREKTKGNKVSLISGITYTTEMGYNEKQIK